jgi:hypothetical protein
MAVEEREVMQDEEPGTITTVLDDDLLATINPETGEVLGLVDAPLEDTAARDIVEWFAGRRNYAKARAAGLREEKAFHQARLDAQYDAQIKKYDNFCTYMEKCYAPICELYAKAKLEAAGWKSKTLKEFFMSFKFTSTRAKVEIVDMDKAVAHIRKLAKDKKLPADVRKTLAEEVIKTSESVLKSMLPEEVKVKLSSVDADTNGLYFYPGGDTEFKLE